MHLFKLDKYADSPNIYAKEMFEVNEFDDIRTMQFKDLIVSKRLVSRLLRDYTEGRPIKKLIRPSSGLRPLYHS